MSKPARVATGLAVACALLLPVTATSADASTKPHKFANCTAMHKVFKHGVGLPGAKDKVARGAKPVTTFTRSAAWYTQNKGLDRDKDKVACEAR